MDSRALVMARIRRALTDVPRTETPGEVPVERTYHRVHGDRTAARTVDLLAENLADYRALVHRADAPSSLPALIARLLADRGATSVAVPPGLPGSWLSDVPDTVRRVPDTAELTPHDLDAVSSVVTGCAVAIAETGTVVLDAAPDQGRRRITLVPDHHICVIRVTDQVVDSVPEALERLDPVRPLTWISGPSATSDIELDRVEGVHGPRTLEVILAGPESAGQS
ncbi:LutC/YkgG family protein [Streptomyces rapamycinicus]|uniref:LutC/YkgG family protein n=1 Tax=Streptomyces rapamycinicus TaxID=1226757 RepID=UPI000EF7F9CE|nr:LUD domain-containing protein [Streptomyces rapamycinicus]UTO67853.1 LUD domain-containing protein [Streptomyces rapamycinicus]UTP37048.1 LUD domain-containing protein [Streptomyces rapamycinicus NRRL 5491]